MDLSSWESTIGATSSSFMSKVQQMTDSLTGKSGEDSNSKPKAIPFSSNPETSQSNDEVWLLGRKYFSQTGKSNYYRLPFPKVNEKRKFVHIRNQYFCCQDFTIKISSIYFFLILSLT